MLKQRLLGKKYRKPSAHYRNRRRKQDAASSSICYQQHPFADRFVVCRVNPIYVDDCYPKSGLPTFLSPNEDFQLHVQTWCSIVCPRHLSTCCVCKPVSIYCDRCGTQTHPCEEYNFDYLKQESCCDYLQKNIVEQQQEQHRTRSYREPPLPLPPLPPKKMSLAVDSSREIHHYHELGPVTSGGGGGDIHDAVRDHGNHIYDSSSHYEQPVPPEIRLIRSVRKKPKPIHVYMNSQFVSGITVPIKNEQIHFNGKERQLLLQSKPGTSGEGYAKGMEVRQKSFREEFELPKHLSVVALEQGLLTRRRSEDVEEMDSLESLKIDEGMFRMSNDENEINSGVNYAKLSLAGMLPTSTASAIAEVHLPDDELAYEAVKDLYEKLSNNKHRKAVTQAVNSLQRSHSLSVNNGGVHTTYETLTKHSRRSYAKLVDEEARRTSAPPTTYYDNILLRSANHDSSKIYANQSFGQFSLAGSKRQSDQHYRNGRFVAEDNFSEVIYETPISSEQVMNRIETDLASQFHLPKPLDKNPNNISEKNESGRPFFKKLQKRFESRAFRDAAKIIATTVLGLTAFGIITALSLSVK